MDLSIAIRKLAGYLFFKGKNVSGRPIGGGEWRVDAFLDFFFKKNISPLYVNVKPILLQIDSSWSYPQTKFLSRLNASLYPQLN
jgi:hypothetical protein